jgi:FAD/FMN-containing dehydrogenase
VPSHEHYDAARHVSWRNPETDAWPAMIARCLGPDDVVRCLAFAGRHDLAIAVRGGGHSFLGWSSCNGGLVIDLSPMRSIEVDAAAFSARAGAGTRVQDLVSAVAPYDLAPIVGQCGEVGISGLTLGGGFGWLSGKHGAACDNLVSANVVTTNGRMVRAAGPVNVRETAGFCIYCSDPTLLKRASPKELVFGYGS